MKNKLKNQKDIAKNYWMKRVKRILQEKKKVLKNLHKDNYLINKLVKLNFLIR